MISKKVTGLIAAAALAMSGPAIAQSAAAAPIPAAESLALSGASSLGGEDGIGWAMGGLILAGVAVVLVLIYTNDDDNEDDGAPASP